jgi:hypothetical protein
MIDAKVTRIINGSHDQVWELLTELTTVNEWQPEVRSVDLLRLPQERSRCVSTLPLLRWNQCQGDCYSGRWHAHST